MLCVYNFTPEEPITCIVNLLPLGNPPDHVQAPIHGGDELLGSVHLAQLPLCWV